MVPVALTRPIWLDGRVAGPIYQGDLVGRNGSPADDGGPIDWQALSPVSVRLSATVAGHIEEMIASGQLPPGGRLPSERHLAELLGVSRGSVREAIMALQVKGLVRRRTGSGTHVLPRHHSAFTDSILSGVVLTDRETTELLDLREAVEPAIAARAAERATTRDLDELRSLEEQFETTGMEALDARIELDAALPSCDRVRDAEQPADRAGGAVHERPRRDAPPVGPERVALAGLEGGAREDPAGHCRP